MLRRLIARLSLHARLLLIAGVTGVAALLFAGFTISHVLERFVLRGLDGTLDTQITLLADAITPDGKLDRARVTELPGFKQPEWGWVWRVRTSAGEWSNSGAVLAADRIRGPHPHHPEGIRPGEGRIDKAGPVHLRQLTYSISAGSVEITTAAPRGLVDRPLRAALGSLLGSLALIGVGLAAATWVQLRYGLRPLRTLSAAVAQVRSGAAARLPDDQPRELQPLVDEVNALIDQNEAGLDHARRHVANLAHGLKTPFATLSLQLARGNAPAESRALVEQLDARIAHHLRRARSAAPSAGGRARSPVGDVVSDLLDALRHVYAEKALTFESDVEAGLSVAVDRQDLDEMLGNLLDNGCKHARGRVRVTARAEGSAIVIDVEDDGRGMTPDEVCQAVRPGERLDESGVGYGFGLTIVHEMAELYGGTLALGPSAALGGLSARVTLPGSRNALETS